MAEQDLWQAAWDGDLEAFKKVLSDHPRVNVNWTDKTFGSTVLNTACIEDNLEMVEILLRRPEVDVNAMDKSGFAPVSLALYKDSDALWKAFAAHPRLDLNICDSTGRTTVWWICYSGHKLALTRLLNSGLPLALDSRAEWNGNMLTPREIALQLGHNAVITMIDSFRAPPPPYAAKPTVEAPKRAREDPQAGPILPTTDGCPACLGPFKEIWAAIPCGHAICGDCCASMRLKPCLRCRAPVDSFLRVLI
jgi:hypothetical protein